MVKKPFHKLFNPKIQDDYNTIFQFLLFIRTSQIRLQNLWIEWKNGDVE